MAWPFHRKSVVLAGGLVVLVGSVSVLGATVLRIKNLQSTVGRPRAHSDGFISGCKYPDGTPDGGKCPASQRNEDRGVYIQSINRSSMQNPYAIGGLGLGQTYTVTTQPYNGYDSAQSIVCINRFVCYRNGVAYCIDNVGDQCNSSLGATVKDGTTVMVTIPSGNSPADGGGGQPHVDIHWKSVRAAQTCAQTCASGCCQNGVCVSNGASNNNACGMGGVACQTCASNQACQNGQCAALSCAQTCTSGCCQNGTCINGGSSDSSACGVGGVACQVCSGGQFCQNGQCLCPSGTSPCGSGCVNTANDDQNCGACGRACTGGQVCGNGSCTSTTHLACSGNNTCVMTAGAGADTDGCAASGDACVKTCSVASDCLSSLVCIEGKCSSNTEANACWGNNGADGRCFDCDGNGVINVLDFSCFRLKYGTAVTP